MSQTVTRPHLSQLLGLAWPIIVSRATQVIVGVADATMVSHLGESALAAITAGALNTYNLLILPMGTVFIVSSFVSQLTGRSDPSGARRYAWYGLGVALAAQVLCLAALPLIGKGVGALGYSPEVRDMMTSYLVIRLCTGGAAVGLEALANYYGGVLETRLPMIAQCTAMVLNVALNWLLIDGRWGMPRLGVSGAALASAISTSVAFCLLFACFLLKLRAPRVVAGPLRRREFWRTLRFGLPSGLNWALEFAAFSYFVNVVVAGLGTTAVAAMMAVIQVSSVAFMPAFGLATAGSIFVGQAIGANAHDDAPRTVRLTFTISAIYMIVIGLIAAGFPRWVLAPFAEPGVTSETFFVVGASMLLVCAIWQVFDAAVATFSEALRAAGDTSFTFWARTLIAWGLFVPGVTLGVRKFGQRETGAALWMALYIALLAAVLVWRFRGGAWRSMKLTEPSVDDEGAPAPTAA